MHSSLSREPINRFVSYSRVNSIGIGESRDYILVILILFTRSQETLEYQIWTINGLFALYFVKQSMDSY